MGTVILDMGQCGCQLGLQLLHQIHQSPMSETNSYIARNDQNIYHSILVDTEPKILKPILDDRKRYSYIDPKNVLFYQYGRGNNWGLGYVDTRKRQEINKTNRIRNDQFDLDKDNEITDLIRKKPIKIKQEFSTGGGPQISTQTYFTENSLILENIIEQTRREIEKTDYFLNILCIMSLAGGTGSGLGSRVLEELRDVLPDIQLDAVAVLPNQSGETPLQHYNCLLSLNHLQKYSDSIIYFQNDRVYQMLNQLGAKKTEKGVDLSNVNEYMASCLMNMISINDTQSNDHFYQELLSECCITPELKFVELMSSPFILNKNSMVGPEIKWEQMIQSCYDQFLYECEEEQDYQNISAMVDTISKDLQQQPVNHHTSKVHTLNLQTICKSVDVKKSLCEQDSLMKFLEKKINSVFNPVKWNPESVNMQYIQNRSSKKGFDQKMVFAMANSTKIVPIIRNISETAYQKFRNNAYLHWYSKYGIEKDYFEEAFQTLQTIDDNYTHMTD